MNDSNVVSEAEKLKYVNTSEKKNIVTEQSYVDSVRVH